jgi:hypothetical protein
VKIHGFHRVTGPNNFISRFAITIMTPAMRATRSTAMRKSLNRLAKNQNVLTPFLRCTWEYYRIVVSISTPSQTHGSA